MTLRSDFRYIIKNWRRPDRRPLWKIALLTPLLLVYIPARKFVDWMDSL